MDNNSEREKKSVGARIKILVRKISKYIGAGIGIIVLLEIGLQGIKILIPEKIDPRFMELSAYKDKPWAKDFYRDQMQYDNLPVLFDRYSIWRLPKLTTQYLNIDEEGRRKTWNPEFVPGTTPKEVWFVGGSVAVSSGSRDDHTIPSDISKALNARSNGEAYRVVNYGGQAYVFSQSTLQLIKLLKLGEHPDYVIFYHGGAEINAAYDTGHGEALAAEANWGNRIEAGSFKELKTGALEIIRDYCLTCRVVINIARRFDSGALRMFPIKGKTYDDARIDALAEDFVKNYTANLTLIESLSKLYRFKYMIVWQPSPFGDRFVGDEQKLVASDWRLKDPNLPKLYIRVLALLNTKDIPHFFDFSKALKERNEQMFFDAVHTSEEGNQMVAEKISNIFPRGM